MSQPDLFRVAVIAPLTPRQGGKHELVVRYAVVGNGGKDWSGEVFVAAELPRYDGAWFRPATPERVRKRGGRFYGAIVRSTSKPGAPPLPIQQTIIPLQLQVAPAPESTGGLSRQRAPELLNLVNAVYGQSGRVEVSRFLSQFSQYRRTSSKQDPAHGNRHLNVDGLKRITRHDFKSRRPAPAERNTYLRFHLSVYEYKSPESAASAFDKLRSEVAAEQDEVPIKSPLYVLQHGDKIYWLSGACMYSRANWNAIEAKLQKALLGHAEPGGDKAIKILCGGALAGV